MQLTFTASSSKVLPSRSSRAASRRSVRVSAERDVPNKYTPVLRKLGSSDLQASASRDRIFGDEPHAPPIHASCKGAWPKPLPSNPFYPRSLRSLT